MKKCVLFIRDIFEVYVPAISFITMFLTFILQVFSRYVLHHPFTWTQEIIVLGFIWTVIFGACYTMRCGTHVKFTMIYDQLPPRRAAIVRMLGDIIVIVTFASLVIASFNYALFIGYHKTPVFRIPYTILFMPFVYFLCSIIGYTAVEILEDLRVIKGVLSDSEDHRNAELSVEHPAEAAK
jgi:TRAP-type C4-dicarboxylate transport system permease small subunit